MNDGCDLCEAAIITTRYFEDELCWIADCEICKVPMVVWRAHGASPPENERDQMRVLLGAIADRELGEGQWSFDDHMRNIPDHYHAHARRPFAWRRA